MPDVITVPVYTVLTPAIIWEYAADPTITPFAAEMGQTERYWFLIGRLAEDRASIALYNEAISIYDAWYCEHVHTVEQPDGVFDEISAYWE